MVLDLVVIGTAITLGPLHNSAFILLLSSRRGVRKGLAFLMSWLANLVTVVAVVLLLLAVVRRHRRSLPEWLGTFLALRPGPARSTERATRPGTR
jgi:threonine/homoserine/homoserine lactone efflux protein